jgi:hypothetical protein
VALAQHLAKRKCARRACVDQRAQDPPQLAWPAIRHHQAAPPVVGQFGVAQQVYAQTLQADAEGRFEFSFNTPFPVPGTKYEIDLVSTKADVTKESRVMLYQRPG